MELTRVNERSGRVHPLADRAWLGLLAPEQVVAWKPPRALVAGIETGLANDDIHEAFVASNRLSLELYRSGQGAAAQDVCRRQIEFIHARLRRGRAGAEPWLVVQGLQPAINLVRIHGYGESLALARLGLGGLAELADGKASEVLGFRVPSYALDEGSVDGRRLRVLARNNLVIETTKILLRRQLSGDRIADIEYLCAKWPSLAADGPFHAHELLCLHRVVWPGGSSVAPAAALELIARVHGLSGPDQSDARGDALALHRLRGQSAFGTGAAYARFLATLGDALYQHDEPSVAENCFRDAQRIAATVDPKLANAILRRWTAHAGGADALPPPVPAPKPDPDQLLKLADMAATRFSPR